LRNISRHVNGGKGRAFEIYNYLSAKTPLQRNTSGWETWTGFGTEFGMNERFSGILLHPTSLSNSYPIGDLGPAAKAFVDFMVESGQHWWQMLPIGPAGEENSPYQSSSAFAGNPLLISPERLMERGFLTLQEIELPPSGGAGKVDYPEASGLKLGWLRKAFDQFQKNKKRAWQSELDA
jgi:4-alpha-glucanotransferase